MNRKLIRHAAAALLLLACAVGSAQGQLRGLGGGGLSGGIGGGGIGGGGGFGGSALPGGSAIPSIPSNPGSSAIPSTSGVPDLLAPSGSVLDRGLPSPNTGSLPNAGNVVDGLYGQTRNTLDGSLGSIQRGALGAGTGLTGRAGAAPISNATRTSRVPPPGERRFVGNEVVIGLRSNVSQQALDNLIRRHQLTRLESWNLALTGTSFHRLQIADRRSVSDVVRELPKQTPVSVSRSRTIDSRCSNHNQRTGCQPASTPWPSCILSKRTASPPAPRCRSR
jgi:hypothetical protein